MNSNDPARVGPSGRARPSALSDHLGFWMRTVSNRVSQAFADRLASKRVAVAEWVALRMLFGTPGEAPARLARAMGVTRGAVTKLADRLIERGLVERRANPADARARILALTEAGARLVPELAALADANDAEFFAHLSPDERECLRRLLVDMAARFTTGAAPVE